ncbi:hypothetical protein Sta7437_4545 (plasmid) [Stanieria cyanosphaera PCC 7437]|uniref:Uncharacterized protein n=1 Tax=Stanieria cyanosphaera (strain ATCC 29371 / PCC 7437) TaxID=111780 RepID=K9Y0U2_STAC7|nr:hypothetical protein [Stanieria cyanosphaera]AFZ38006.1 hypothetical protein Sta7437_4545 [Stanieria cyanosphaera PCC 7437]
MDYDLEQKLWNAGQTDQIYKKEIWLKIVYSLLSDFQKFIGQSFEKDEEINMDINNPFSPSFGIWIWKDGENLYEGKSNIIDSSIETNNKKFLLPSITWSGVMGGDMIGSKENDKTQEIFSVSLTLFLFDSINKERIRLDTGESIIEFVYKKHSNGHGNWISLGWHKDIYGEWEDIQYE